MEQTIVQVDLGKIESEIAELNAKIKALMDERDKIEYFRKYIQSHSVATSGSYSMQTVINPTILRDVDTKGISEFIIDYLDAPKGAKDIAEAYAVYTNKTREQVANNIYNALTRLKSKGKLENKEGMWKSVK